MVMPGVTVALGGCLGVTTHSLILLHRPLILLHRSLLKANTRTAPPLTHSADRSLNSAPPLIAKG
eukprot:1142473-Pelagomonas_calceolata.AAC.16